MQIVLSEEQQILRDGVARFVANEHDFQKRHDFLETEQGHAPELWRQIAELGWLGAGLPEDMGGFGGGPAELALIIEELGRGLVLEPFLTTAVFGGQLLSRHGNLAQQSELLPAIAMGETRVALAYGEAASRGNPCWVETRAEAGDDGYLISGQKSLVLDAALADWIVVSCRTESASGDAAGIALFLLDADADGLNWRHFRTYDGMRASTLELKQVRVARDQAIGPIGEAGPILEEIVDLATALTCAEAVGAMQALFDLLLEHLKTREQFGRPIGSFQALQHRAAELYMALNDARSMSREAVRALDREAAERRRTVAAAKVQINESAALIGGEGVQMHGAIAITDEYAASHYFKRLEAIETLFGDSEYHLGRFTADYA